MPLSIGWPFIILAVFMIGIGAGFMISHKVRKQNPDFSMTITLGDRSVNYKGTPDQIIKMRKRHHSYAQKG
jgi:hypothetical protein